MTFFFFFKTTTGASVPGEGGDRFECVDELV